MNLKNAARLGSLLWVVFTDSLGWGIAFSIFAALFLDKNASFLAGSFLQNYPYAFYEFLLGLYGIFTFLFAPVLGGISDAFGRKPSLQISMLGLTFGFILSAAGCYWGSLILLILGRIISGMTAGSLSVAQAAAVDMSTKETKPFYLSMLVFANCLGFSCGPVLGGILLQRELLGPLGVTTFLVAAIMALVGFLSIWFLFQETRNLQAEKPTWNIKQDFGNIKIAFSNPALRNCLLSFLFSMLAYGLFFSNIPVFLHRIFSVDAATTGFVLSGFAIILSVSLIVGGKYIFFLLQKTTVVLAAQIIQLAMYTALFFCIPSLHLNYVLFGIIAFTLGLMYVGLLTIISDATKEDWQGRIMGVISSLFALVWAGGPFLAGAFNYLGRGAAFAGAAILVSLGLWRFTATFSKASASADGKVIREGG